MESSTEGHNSNSVTPAIKTLLLRIHTGKFIVAVWAAQTNRGVDFSAWFSSWLFLWSQPESTQGLMQSFHLYMDVDSPNMSVCK